MTTSQAAGGGATTRCLIADDQAMVREGFAAVLAAQHGLLVVGQAADGADAVRRVRDLRPDLALMDVRMPVMDGLQATRHILAAAGPVRPRVLMLTTFDLDEYVYAALRAGASGFLLKDALAADLVKALQVVMAGDAVVAPSATRRLIERFLASSAEPDRARAGSLSLLTEREREVLALVARGLSNAEIAGRLFLSEGTVKTHVSRLLGKLELRDRVQAVVLAYETGVVRPGA